MHAATIVDGAVRSAFVMTEPAPTQTYEAAFFAGPFIPPAILLEQIPISERASNIVSNTRVAIAHALDGSDPVKNYEVVRHELEKKEFLFH